jgi:mannose-6-phosphate isomerase-like protein (cupin superfamily)
MILEAEETEIDDFPEFMRNPRNAIDPKSQSPGNIGYVFDGIDGSQMAIWTSTKDVVSKEVVHDHDEYFNVVEGEYKLKINNETTPLRKGDECHVPKGVPHSGESKKETRMICALGSKRAKRIGEG